MKIAIPTDDGLMIRPTFSKSKGYVVATVKDRDIIHREIRWNLLSEIITSPDGIYYNLHDCHVVLVNEIGPLHDEILRTKNKQVVYTTSATVTKAFMDYLNSIPVLVEEK